VRKYVCDNCGKEIVENDLYVATAKRQGDSRFTRTTVPDEVVLGEFCLECLRKVGVRIKEGVN